MSNLLCAFCRFPVAKDQPRCPQCLRKYRNPVVDETAAQSRGSKDPLTEAVLRIPPRLFGVFALSMGLVFLAIPLSFFNSMPISLLVLPPVLVFVGAWLLLFGRGRKRNWGAVACALAGLMIGVVRLARF